MVELELLIFDMDGLMFDTERVSKACWLAVGKQYGYEFSQDIFNAITGLDNRRMVEVFKAAYGADFPFEAVLQEQRRLMAENIRHTGVPVKPGLTYCLDEAAKQGLKLAVASSTPRDTVCAYLKETDLLHYFDYIFSGEQIKRGKPWPDVFLAVCEALQILPARTIVLEDSQNGLKAAAAGAIRSIWIPDIAAVSPEVAASAWKQVKTLAEVPALLVD